MFNDWMNCRKEGILLMYTAEYTVLNTYRNTVLCKNISTISGLEWSQNCLFEW